MLTQEERGRHWQAVNFYAIFLNHIKSVIAGGAARDILLGKAPRDYDIWVMADASIADVLNAVGASYAQYREQFGDAEVEVHNIYADDYDESEEDEMLDIEFVMKCEFNGIEIDIIKPAREAGREVGAIEVLETFDFPCNQFMLLADSRVVGSGHMKEKQVAQRLLRPNRLSKMRQKLPQFEFIDLH